MIPRRAQAPACALLACALAGCGALYRPAPVLSANAAGLIPPDPNGPCLQQTSLRRRGTWLWRDGALVDHNDLVAATREDPVANGLARDAERRRRAVLPVAALGFGGILSFITTNAALAIAKSNDTTSFLIAWGTGAGVFFTSIAAVIGLSISAQSRTVRARVAYNDWARTHGCRALP
jgi:hypothetical protein